MNEIMDRGASDRQLPFVGFEDIAIYAATDNMPARDCWFCKETLPCDCDHAKGDACRCPVCDEYCVD